MAINIPIVSSFDSKGIDKAVRDFKKLEGGAQKSAFGLLNADAAARRGVAAFAKFAAIGAGAAGVIGSKLVSAAYESQKVMKQTEAIIKATGGAAGVTAVQVAKLSERLAAQVGVDDELIQQSANLLLTFKQVQNQVGEGNQIFDRALKTSLDLGNVFGSSSAAAMQLGKALSDPVRGITALRRAGINFTEQQRDQIKSLVASGKTLDAQKLILKEVESQVGGTAEATATGFDKMRVAVENVMERLGGMLIPVVERFANYVTNTVVPVLNTFADIVGERGVGAGVQYLFTQIVQGVWNMGALGKAILVAVGAFTALRVATVTYTAAMTAMNVVTTLSNGALATLIKSLGQARIAMLAAGGITALLGLAAIAYGQYASQKEKATARTRDFVNALTAEGTAQSELFKELTSNNSQFKIMVASLGDVGLSMDDVNEYINNGTGKFVKFVEALDKVPASASKGVEQLDAYAKVVGIVAGAQSSVGGELAFGLSELAGVAKKARGEAMNMADVMNLLSGIGVKFNNSMTGAGNGVETLEEKLEKARQKFREFKSQAESVFSQQKSLRDATKDTSKAYTELSTATAKVASAQAYLNQIVKGYGAGSTQATEAQDALTQAQRDAERAGYDLEKANFAVTDAEKDLAEARAEGDPQKIREAEIALAEAKLSVKDAEDALTAATRAVTAAQTALNEAINGASTESETYKNALAELKTAQDEELAAIDRVNEAKIREFEITKKLAEAELALAKIKKTLSKKQLKDAQRVIDSLGEMPSGLITAAPSQASPIAPFDFTGLNILEGLNLNLGNIPIMGNGGIVRRPTLALIGESGPEAVLPLPSNNQVPSGGGTTIHVNVHGTDPQAIVDALRKYVRQNGSLGWVA